MNKTSIKNYAIWARNELINRVTQKAYEYGVEKDNIIPSVAESINGRLLSADEKSKRQKLITEVNHKGYDQVIEEVAYTWFNRFIALRFMEVNNYLPNKVRLFTNENNEFKPQIIDEALHIELQGLDRNKVIELKEANNNEELYKELLLATCNDMHQYLPGMFETIDDYMTLLFPNNLLREESVLGRLISDIDEDSWTDQVQIIGWLYQYYNTEPKDKTFADLKKNIKISKDKIPSATQLFTPDWIVRYMTENSLGRLWLDGHEDKGIKSNWKYYLDEAEQEPEVQVELDKIKAEHAKLTPADIKFLDPCMGSGHILVYAFDVFMQIYVSEGWTEREAAKSILQNNLYGLDIDERAYQLSYFALMMKARQYNRRILSEGIKPNVMAIEESNTFNRSLLDRFGDLKSLATKVIDIFHDAKEYGSILNVDFTKEELDSLEARLNEIDKMADYGNLLVQMESIQLVDEFYPFLKQARIMSQKYECVVTNPPYMGNGGMSQQLSDYISKFYADGKSDLFAAFIIKCIKLLSKTGKIGMMTSYTWMFLSGYQAIRENILYKHNIESLVQPEYHSFFEEAYVPICAFVVENYHTGAVGQYIRLERFTGADQQNIKTLEAVRNKNCEYRYTFDAEKLHLIPGSPLVYWGTDTLFKQYSNYPLIQDIAQPRPGLSTGENERFLRLWFESSLIKISFEGLNKRKWYPINKGGDYRKWYGNHQYIVNWENDGYEIKNFKGKNGKLKSRPQNLQYNFKDAISWSLITTGPFSVRFYPDYFMQNAAGICCYPEHDRMSYLLAFLNTKPAQTYASMISPTINTNAGDIARIPFVYENSKNTLISKFVDSNINLSRADWDSFETSWDFKTHPLMRLKPAIDADRHVVNTCGDSALLSPLEYAYNMWMIECDDRFNQLKSSEEELNRIFIDIYGLQDELTPEVEDKDVTVRKADLTRDIKSLISYAVGCMFGRYSLDTEGLAFAGGEWDDSKYSTFIPDKDNIIPICDDEYFEDDIVGRFIEFIKVAYGEETLEDNLKFIADALGGKESPREVIRNYFINDFFKDHCNTYQVTGSGKRPIYWQFDSGKKNGFKALIYIHRYTPDLIARMRTSYVHEQQSRYANQIAMTENMIDSAASTSERVKLEKKLKQLKDQAEEIRVYEEKIHHWADKMEPMDLDDGVKANYAKFQELLTKIK